MSAVEADVAPDPALETLALCAHLFGNEHGANLLRRALHAAVIAKQGVDPRAAVELAMYGVDMPTYEAGEERNRLIKQAESDLRAVERAEAVAW